MTWLEVLAFPVSVALVGFGAWLAMQHEHRRRMHGGGPCDHADLPADHTLMPEDDQAGMTPGERAQSAYWQDRNEQIGWDDFHDGTTPRPWER